MPHIEQHFRDTTASQMGNGTNQKGKISYINQA